MNRRRVWALIRKDWLELRANPQAMVPLIVLPLILAVALPAGILVLGTQPALLASVNGMDSFLDAFPPGLVPAGTTEGDAAIYALITFFFAPMFLLIPVMVSSVVASSSFAGEKERHTFEGLAYTPLTDRELVLGKVLASAAPAVALTWVSFGCYVVLVRLLGRGPLAGGAFPTPTWLVLIGVLTPLLAFLTTALTAGVSARAKTMQSAQNSAMFVILPMLALVVSQATGVFLLSLWFTWVLVAVVAVADVVAYFLVVTRLDRERILTSF